MDDDSSTCNQLEIGESVSTNLLNNSANASTNERTMDAMNKENNVVPLWHEKTDDSKFGIRNTVIAMNAIMMIATTWNLPSLISNMYNILCNGHYYDGGEMILVEDPWLVGRFMVVAGFSFMHIFIRIVYSSVGLYGAIRLRQKMIFIAEVGYLYDGTCSLLFTKLEFSVFMFLAVAFHNNFVGKDFFYECSIDNDELPKKK